MFPAKASGYKVSSIVPTQDTNKEESDGEGLLPPKGPNLESSKEATKLAIKSKVRLKQIKRRAGAHTQGQHKAYCIPHSRNTISSGLHGGVIFVPLTL